MISSISDSIAEACNQLSILDSIQSYLRQWQRLQLFEDKCISSWRIEFSSLPLEIKDLKRLLKVFNKIDRNNKEAISIPEFLHHLHVRQSKFTKRLFVRENLDQHGNIQFREFVLTLWKYCTLSQASLVLFTFDIYDVDSNGFIGPSEMEAMIDELLGKAPDKELIRELKQLQLLYGEFGMEAFQDFVRRRSSLMFPVFQLQLTMQQRVLGKRFWTKLAEKHVHIGNKIVPVSLFLEMQLNDKMKAAGIQRAGANGNHLASLLSKTGSRYSQKYETVNDEEYQLSDDQAIADDEDEKSLAGQLALNEIRFSSGPSSPLPSPPKDSTSGASRKYPATMPSPLSSSQRLAKLSVHATDVPSQRKRKRPLSAPPRVVSAASLKPKIAKEPSYVLQARLENTLESRIFDRVEKARTEAKEMQREIAIAKAQEHHDYFRDAQRSKAMTDHSWLQDINEFWRNYSCCAECWDFCRFWVIVRPKVAAENHLLTPTDVAMASAKSISGSSKVVQEVKPLPPTNAVGCTDNIGVGFRSPMENEGSQPVRLSRRPASAAQLRSSSSLQSGLEIKIKPRPSTAHASSKMSRVSESSSVDASFDSNRLILGGSKSIAKHTSVE